MAHLLLILRLLEAETAMDWAPEGFSLERTGLPQPKPLPTVTPRPVGRKGVGRALPEDEDEE